MNNHRRTSRKGQQEGTVQISEIENDLAIKKARVSYLRQLRSRVPQFQEEKNGNNGKERGEVISLRKIASDKSRFRRAYGLSSLYFIKEGTFHVLIPKDAKIEKREGNVDFPNPYFDVEIGSVHLFVSGEIEPVPGTYVEGRGELMVKRYDGREHFGREHFPYVNFWKPLEDREKPETLITLDFIKREVPEGSSDLTPSARDGMVVHTDPFESWDDHVPFGITIIDKRGK